MVERPLNIIPECVTVNFWLPEGLNLLFLGKSEGLAAVFVEQAGDKKDVMAAGKDGKSEDGHVQRRQVITGSIREASSQHDDADRDNLDECIDLPQC